jgi:GNAT superfamily N-acetyltransferase
MTAAVSLPSFAIRIATPEDRTYIECSWRKAERAANGHLERERFAQCQDAAMRAILDRESTVVTIAHPVADPEVIAGYLAARPPVKVIRKGPSNLKEIGPAPIVYFLFVRDECRRLGIARALLGELPERRDVVFTTRPAQVKDGEQWKRSPLPIPRAWQYVARAQFVEIA